MSVVTVEDVCLWTKHIDGNQALSESLRVLEDNQLVVLNVDGVKSVWRKMAQGKNPKPTDGLKPACDLCSRWWQDIYHSRKGDKVTIALCE